MKIILKSKYLFPTILLNYRCEENPPGSGNFKCDVTASSDKENDKYNKNRLKELKITLKEVKDHNQSLRDQMDKVPRDSDQWKELQKQIDVDAEYKLEDQIKTLQYKHPDVPEDFKPFLQNSDNIIKNLSPDESHQLDLYVFGAGNSIYQSILTNLKGNIPDNPEQYIKDMIGKRYSWSDDKSFNPNDPFQKSQYESTMETFNNSMKSIKLLDSVLEKSKTTNDIVVQSGVSPVRLGIDQLSVGTEFKIPIFLSTSRSDKVANGFALRKVANAKKRDDDYITPTVLEIHLNAGSKAIALENFVLQTQGANAEWVIGDKGVAGTGSQQEVLLARNTRCTVREIKQETFRGKAIRKIIVDASN